MERQGCSWRVSCFCSWPARHRDLLLFKKIEQAPLNGMVYDYDNRPVSDVAVVLDEKWKIETDINGRFSFPLVEPGDYTLELEKEGYEPLERTFHFHSRTQVFYIKIVPLDQLSRRIETANRRLRLCWPFWIPVTTIWSFCSRLRTCTNTNWKTPPRPGSVSAAQLRTRS